MDTTIGSRATNGAVYARMVLVQVFWAGTFVASEIALHDQPPALTAVVRFVLTTAIYVAMCVMLADAAAPRLRERVREISAGGWLALAAMGFFGVSLYTLLLHLGLGASTAAYAALLIPTTQPIFTAILGRLAFRDAVGSALVVGLALGLVGAGLVILGGLSVSDTALLGGNLVIVAAALSFSCYAVSAKFAPATLSSTESTTLSFVFGTLFLLPMPVLMGESLALAGATPPFWLSIAYLVVFATVLPYLWWNDAVKRIGSARTGIFTFLMPPMAVALAALVLGHTPGPQQILGGALALAGVALATFGWPGRGKAV
ncbi:DMT family transporter [Salinarimonas chemoclinalis]|uniref:DMT family transporter n=1 Tax=Salinarimonas chemoclinalis TaxID=3241599 RepID=UPI003555F943